MVTIYYYNSTLYFSGYVKYNNIIAIIMHAFKTC